MQPPKPPDKHELFQSIALLGPAVLLQTLIPPEKVGDYSHFSAQNSQRFLLLRILVEVQKSGFAVDRWRKIDTTPDLQLPSDKLSSIHRQMLESCVDEQSVWQRKLSEALVLLINFSKTNSAEHYLHYLLVQERARQEGKCRDHEKYFGKESDTCTRKLQVIENRIREAANAIGDQDSCWYVDGQRLRISSFARQLALALDNATPLERTALSYTYCKGFGETSGNIHFNALRPSPGRPYDRFLVGFSSCGLLAINILKRSHELTGTIPSGVNERVLKTASSWVGNDPTKGAAEKGDFVLVDGPCLAVVEEVATTRYGYEVYRVRIMEPPEPDKQPSEWFSAFDITPFQKQREQLDNLKQMIAEYGETLEPPPSEEEMQEALQAAMGTIWHAGLGQHVKETATRSISEPCSQGPRS